MSMLLTVLGSLAAAGLFAVFALAGLLVEAHDRFPVDLDRRPLAERARAAVRAALPGRVTLPVEVPGQEAVR